MANPSAVYCKDLGYQYKIVKTDKGEEGICTFPDKTECEVWDFLKGKCGQNHSYCAKKGYDTKMINEKGESFSKEYVACIIPDNSYNQSGISGESIKTKEISVLELMKANNETSEKFSISTNPTNQESPTELLTIFQKLGLLFQKLTIFQKLGLFLENYPSSYPSSFDWRNKDGNNWVTPIRDQGQCGSCWAFAVTAEVESRINIVLNNPNFNKDLSEQYLVSCDSANKGCSGGWSSVALNYYKQYGVPDENCFPYTATNNICSNRCSDWTSRLVKIKDYTRISGTVSDIKQKISDYGPITAYMDVYSDFFSYTGGIYHHTTSTRESTHIITLVGYNDAGQYWIGKNSWGTGWGESGYFRMNYDETNFLLFIYESYYITDTDIDLDGVGDSVDACPTTYGTWCNGCPQPNCGICKYAYCPSSGAPYCANYGTSTLCNSNFQCSAGTGDNKYGIGGEYSCNCYCDGSGSCDYAGNCIYSAECDPDDDNDGVLDVNDFCPNTPLGQLIDANGCSQSQVDQDFDGLCNPGSSSTWCNGTDACPSNYGLICNNGCPDLTAPSITISNPPPYDIYQNKYLDTIVNLTFSNTCLDSVWWSINNGITNNSLNSPYDINISSWTRSNYTLLVFANDSSGHLGKTTYFFIIDNKPNILYYSPNNICQWIKRTDLIYLPRIDGYTGMTETTQSTTYVYPNVEYSNVKLDNITVNGRIASTVGSYTEITINGNVAIYSRNEQPYLVNKFEISSTGLVIGTNTIQSRVIGLADAWVEPMEINYEYNKCPFTLDVSVAENYSLNFSQTSTDPDNDTLLYFWKLDGIIQNISQNWTFYPGFFDAGIHNITLMVFDGDLIATHNWNVTVNNTNRPPIWIQHPENQIIEEDTTLVYDVNASDLDIEPITYYINDSVFTINSNTGVITYTPPSNFYGIKYINLTASDGIDNTTADIIVNVTPVNDAPVLDFISNVNVNELDLVNITVNASDVEGDNLTYFINDAKFTKINQSFIWQTTFQDSGVHSVNISVSDSFDDDWQIVIITVLDVEDADNDGINNTDDYLFGNSFSINTTLGINVTINGSSNLSQIFNGTLPVNIIENNNSLVEFNWTFKQTNVLNLSGISIEKQTNASTKGYIVVKGINLTTQNRTKTIYLDHINKNLNTICVSDKEIASITEISLGCNEINETLVFCNITVQNGYSCTIIENNTRYRISGLIHSGINEQCSDNDKDGYGVGCSSGNDCNDNDSTIYPGAPELCDSVDNDCDGTVDEECSSGTSGSTDRGGGVGGRITTTVKITTTVPSPTTAVAKQTTTTTVLKTEEGIPNGKHTSWHDSFIMTINNVTTIVITSIAIAAILVVKFKIH